MLIETPSHQEAYKPMPLSKSMMIGGCVGIIVRAIIDKGDFSGMTSQIMDDYLICGSIGTMLGLTVAGLVNSYRHGRSIGKNIEK